MRNIFNVFGRSPFTALGHHMKKCVETANKVPELITAIKAADHARVKEIAKEVMTLEHEADEIKNELRDSLPRSLFLAIDRRDFRRLLSAQDEIADRTEDLVVVATLKPDFTIPSELVEELDRVVGHVMDCINQAHRIGDELDELLESGFGGPEAEKVFEMVQKVGEIEHMADKRQYKFSQTLVSIADNLKPVDLLLLTEFIINLGGIANAAEKYSKELRNVLAK
ncbi:MAG: TIGR00153 family protein [bacterium]|nr:TIGR00153 family protein [bacterium]